MLPMNLSTEITVKDVFVPVRGFQYFRARARRKMKKLYRELNRQVEGFNDGVFDAKYVEKTVSQIDSIKTKLNLVKYVYQPLTCVVGVGAIGYGLYKGLESIL